MKKKISIILGSIAAGLILLGALGSSRQPESLNANVTTSTETKAPAKAAPAPTPQSTPTPKPTPTCDGTKVTKGCVVDNINYSTYIYHEAVAEKSHNETTTTYEQKVTSYCTRCNDDTYSPSCATGRGACSHHGGVAQWNAPRYSSVPVQSTKKIIDTPAQEAYYEKVVQEAKK